MAKKKNEVVEAACEAAKAAKSALSEELKNLVNGEIELDADEEIDSPKYKIVHGVPMQQYGGQIVKTSGMLDPTETVVAVAIARPGSTTWANGQRNSMTRTPMFGDVAVYAFDNAKKKLGMKIMPSKSWMIMQSKSANGDVRPPFIRTPWDVKQTVTSQTGNLQPPTFDRAIRSLCDAAINLAAVECSQRIKENKPSQTQESYATAVAAAAEMAETISSRRGSVSRSQNPQTQADEGLSSAAADLLSN